MLTRVNKIPIFSCWDTGSFLKEERRFRTFCLTHSMSLYIGLKINDYKTAPVILKEYKEVHAQEAALWAKFSLKLSRIWREQFELEYLWNYLVRSSANQWRLYHKSKINVSLYIHIQFEMSIFSGRTISSLYGACFVICYAISHCLTIISQY